MVLDGFSRYTNGFLRRFMDFAMDFDSVNHCVFGVCRAAPNGVSVGGFEIIERLMIVGFYVNKF